MSQRVTIDVPSKKMGYVLGAGRANMEKLREFGVTHWFATSPGEEPSRIVLEGTAEGIEHGTQEIEKLKRKFDDRVVPLLTEAQIASAKHRFNEELHPPASTGEGQVSAIASA